MGIKIFTKENSDIGEAGARKLAGKNWPVLKSIWLGS